MVGPLANIAVLEKITRVKRLAVSAKANETKKNRASFSAD